MDKIKIVADFAPELSECTLHLFSYVSLHDCIVLINFCYTALGFAFLILSKVKTSELGKSGGGHSNPGYLYSFILMSW